MLLELIPPIKTQQTKVIAEQKLIVLTTNQTKILQLQTEAIIREVEITHQGGVGTQVVVEEEV